MRNISDYGAFIEHAEQSDLEGMFQVVFKVPGEQPFSVSGEPVWSGSFDVDGKMVGRGVGIRFTRISPAARQFISSLVSRYRATPEEDRKQEKLG